MTDLSTIEELSEHEMNTEFTASSHRRHPSSGSGSNFPSAISQLTEPSGFTSSGFHANNANGRPPVIGESSYYSTGDEESYFPGENDEREEAASYGPGAASSSRPPATSMRTTSGGSVPTVFTNEPVSHMSRTPSAKQVATTTGDRPARRWLLKTLLLLVVLVVVAVVMVVLLAGGGSSASALDENRDAPSPTLSPTTSPITSAPTAVPTPRVMSIGLPQLDFPINFPILPITEAPTRLADTEHPTNTDRDCPVRPPSMPATFDSTRYVDYALIWRGGAQVDRGVCDQVSHAVRATCRNGGHAVLLTNDVLCKIEAPDMVECPAQPGGVVWMRCWGEEFQIGLSLEVLDGSTECFDDLNRYWNVVSAVQRCENGAGDELFDFGGFICTSDSWLVNLDGVPYCGLPDDCSRGRDEASCTLTFEGASLDSTNDIPACRFPYSVSRGVGEPCDVDDNCAFDVCASGLCRAGPGCIGADCETDDHCLGGGQCIALECTDGET
jgi:hypothetical protein